MTTPATSAAEVTSGALADQQPGACVPQADIHKGIRARTRSLADGTHPVEVLRGLLLNHVMHVIKSDNPCQGVVTVDHRYGTVPVGSDANGLIGNLRGWFMALPPFAWSALMSGGAEA